MLPQERRPGQSQLLAQRLIDTLMLGRPIAAEVASSWPPGAETLLTTLATREGAASWLYHRLRSAGEHACDPASMMRTRAMEETGALLRVESAATEALGVLRDAGIETILLKGVAYHAIARRYPLIDARSSIDVDLLVSPATAVAAWRALANAGFEMVPTPEFAPREGHHHLSGLWSSQRVPIELHVSTARSRPPAEAWERLRSSAITFEWNRLQVLVPSPTELVWHAVEHSCSHGPVGFMLRQYLPAAALLASPGAVDIELLRERLRTEPLFEAEGALLVAPRVAERWLAIAGALGASSADAGGRGVPPGWGDGYALLSRLLAWRLSVLRVESRLPRLSSYLWESGTRSAMGFGAAPPIRPSAWRYRLQRRALVTLSWATYAIFSSGGWW